jgi:hypothetical protein
MYDQVGACILAHGNTFWSDPCIMITSRLFCPHNPQTRFSISNRPNMLDSRGAVVFVDTTPNGRLLSTTHVKASQLSV